MLRPSRILGLVLVLTAVCAAAQSAPDARELVRRAAENDKANEKRARDYMYVERVETHKHQGDSIKTESQTNEVFVLYGERVKRRIAKDDHPLSEKEAAAEESRIAKLIAKRKDESEAERRKREAKFDKEEEENRRYLDEVVDAYTFTLVGTEAVNGREAWVVAADPRRGYRPKMKQARFLSKIRIKAWIDHEEAQVARLEAEVIDNISFGLFVAKVNRGGRLELQQARINEEVWLPLHMAAKADARVLVKHFDFDIDVTCRDYRKFRTDSRITGVVEEQLPPPPPQR